MDATPPDSPCSPAVRRARPGDVAALTTLRRAFHAEASRARGEPTSATDAPSLVEASTRKMVEQDVVSAFIAVAAGASRPAVAAPALVGYAAGRFSVWPPIWRVRRVGEIIELFVVPDRRGADVEAALLDALSRDLVDRGAETLRAQVGWADRGSRRPYEAAGFTSLFQVLVRHVGTR